MPENGIRYLLREEIDTSKWDNCIQSAPGGTVYATAAFLDHMSTCWSALVAGDYNTVMPLPYRKKFGFDYLYQPAFCQQLGVITQMEDGRPVDADYFLAAIPKRFRFWEINLNSKNTVRNYNFNSRKNFLLNLSSDFATLQTGYSRMAKRNIRKAQDAGVIVEPSGLVNAVMDLHGKRFGSSLGPTQSDYQHLADYVAQLPSENKLILIAKNSFGNLIASSLYLIYKNRVVFLLNGNLSESLRTGATHLLKDFCIRKFAGSNMILDFEGSDNPDFARFYQQFGAHELEYYPAIYYNKLPPFIRWLKQKAKQ